MNFQARIIENSSLCSQRGAYTSYVGD